jgi:P27 family predicted phage terminase small subunit
MAGRTKPIDLKTGELAKDKARKRAEMEANLKGKDPISKKAPIDLSDSAKTIYKQIIDSFPNDYLNKTDSYLVSIVADSLANMAELRRLIDEQGLLAASETKLIISYQKYADIFKKYSLELGLSPSGRSQLGYLASKQEEEANDPLLKVLRGNKK